MNPPECDLKGHGPCGGSIYQRGMTLNYRCDVHVRLQSYWSRRNPGKKLNDWLDELSDINRQEALKNSPPRGEYWHEVEVNSLSE